MEIVLASDDNYAGYLGITLISLFENNKKIANLRVHILDNMIKSNNIKKIERIAIKYNRKLNFYSLEEYNKKLKVYNVKGISIAAYSRLFLSDILIDLEKVIYMDVDSLVLCELEEIWNIDLKEKLVAGVEDIVPNKYKTVLGLKENFKYINSGFLLLNLNLMRKENFIGKSLTILKQSTGSEIHHDQGVINKICAERIEYLHPKYNVMTPFYMLKYNALKKFYKLDEFYPKTEIQEAKDNPVFIHFTPSFTSRVWVKGCRHPERNRYYNYIKNSEWNIDELIKKNDKKIKIRISEYYFRNFYNFFRWY